MKQAVVDDSRELISALADGELRGEELERALKLVQGDEAARAYWHACHVAGDVLRARDLARGAADDAAFVSRLGTRLPARPARQAHRWLDRPAANDAWRWPRVAGVAALLLGAVVVWRLEGAPADAPAQLAQSGAAAPAAPVGQVMIRDPRLDQLLAAHRELGGVSALQKPAGFLRNATFERALP